MERKSWSSKGPLYEKGTNCELGGSERVPEVSHMRLNAKVVFFQINSSLKGTK